MLFHSDAGGRFLSGIALAAAAFGLAACAQPPGQAQQAAAVESAAPAANMPLVRIEVQEAQELLRRLGYGGGGADGVVGPMTRSAAAAYQKDMGAPATGNVDRALLEMLRNSASASGIRPVASPPPVAAAAAPAAQIASPAPVSQTAAVTPGRVSSSNGMIRRSEGSGGSGGGGGGGSGGGGGDSGGGGGGGSGGGGGGGGW